LLQVENSFPFPGSVALLHGLRWRVLSHAADQTALLSRIGPNTALTRRAPIGDLVDPKIADENAIIALTDASEASARIGLFIARHLRDANEIAMATLRRQLAEAAREGRIPDPRDNFQIAMLLRRLGWRKAGYVQDSGGMTARYVRSAAK
jgi:hypothetical protein